MRKRNLSMLLLVLLMVAACGTINSNLTPEARYLTALKYFNNNVATYLAAYDAADKTTQAKWKKEIDPKIRNADDALGLWGSALFSSDTTGQERLWMGAKDLMMQILFQNGIIEVEGGN